LNEYQVLIQIANGTITRLSERATPKPPTYLAIRYEGENIYFEDFLSRQILVYEPVMMALFHQVCEQFCQRSAVSAKNES
jgi:hypothetical protein